MSKPPLYIHIKKSDDRIIRVAVKETEITDAWNYVERLKGHCDIKSVFFDDQPGLINCDFGDAGSRQIFLPY